MKIATDTTIRQAAEDDGTAYCPDCLVADGTDARCLTDYGTARLPASRLDQDTRTLADTLHVFGWYCERHDTYCVRDPFEFEPPIDGMLTVAIESAIDGEVLGHIPVHDLDRDRERYYHPDDESLTHPSNHGPPEDADPTPDDLPEWAENYDTVIVLNDHNAPRSCGECGDPADYYVLPPYVFTCGYCVP